MPVKDTDNLTCDICYNDRPKDMMIKCCDKNNIKVCECNVSICRRCSDSMTLKCPTCRTKCAKFVYVDEAKDKPVKVKKTKTDTIPRRPVPELSSYIVGQNVVIIQKNEERFKLDVRKARIVKINASSLTIQYYSYIYREKPNGPYYRTEEYLWTDRLEEQKIVIKDLRRIKTIQDNMYAKYFKKLSNNIYLMT